MLRSSILLVLLLAGLVPAVAANAPQVTLEVQPATVSVPPQGDADVLVIFRNASDQRLSGLRLSWLTPSGVKVATESTELPDVGPFEEVSGTLRVSRDPQKPVPGEVSLRVAYHWLRDGREVPRIAMAPLKVSLQQPDKIEQVASVEVKTSAKAVFEHRPGRLYLVVTNTSNEPIEVVRVEPVAPSFIQVTVQEPSQARALGPRDTLVIPCVVEAKGNSKDPLKPGKHLILFKVALNWKSSGRALSGFQVASHETDVGVLGESEVLTALGVPTFLVLPGFLMVVTFSLLWKLAPSRSGQARKEFPVAAKSAEFWLVAVSLSMLAAALYPRVTERLGARRSYLEGYDLADVIRVWTASILVAAVAFVLLDTLAAWRAAQKQKRVFNPGDGPLAVLRKLKVQKAAVYRQRADVKMDGKVRRAFVLQRDGNQYWIAPGIRLLGMDQADAAVKKSIGDQLTQNGDPGALADLIEGTQGRVRADWDPSPVYGFEGVRSVPVADVQGALLPANSLVQVESEEIE
ncbi:MAG TPA: hypothetical protein VN493_11305 [Thermoanaerobaculia bacterium]|nr:hypothetical protein [Thermoanaerobaculia bacterium]